MLFDSALDAICMAPIVRVCKIFPNHNVWLKGEFLQSKNMITERSDRFAHYILSITENNNINPNNVLVVHIDSNIKISLAKVGLLKGFQVLVVSPNNLLAKHKAALSKYGADIIYTPSSQGTQGAKNEAEKLIKTNPGFWTPKYHKETILIEALAYEIKQDFTQGLDYIVIPTHSPIRINYFAFIIKKTFPRIKIFMASSHNDIPIKQDSKNSPYAHKPKNLKYIDGTIIITKDRSLHISNVIPIKEGLPNNITSGISFNAVEKLIMKHNVSSSDSILTFQTEL